MDESKKRYFIRVSILVFADALSISLAYLIALSARFDFYWENIPEMYLKSIVRFLPASIVISIIVYYFLKLYHSIWRYASEREIYRIIIAYVIIGAALLLVNHIQFFNIPNSCLFYGHVMSLVFCVGIRFAYRLMRNLMLSTQNRGQEKERVLLVGAGFSAVELLKNDRFTRRYRVVSVVDDNPSTWGRFLEGVKIEGGRDKIQELVEKHNINTIVFAIPSAAREVKGQILSICKETGCKLQTVPGINAEEASKLTNINIGDMVGHDLIPVNEERINDMVRGKTILITGAGGSVGTGIAERVAAGSPSELILLDLNRNALYETKRRLNKNHPQTHVTCLLADCSDIESMKNLTADMVFHAAAIAATGDQNDAVIRENNEAAIKGTMAVNSPKKILLTGVDEEVKEKDAVVIRMGYILDTNPDPIRLFRNQVEEGGPVTVPDANMVRNYITVKEAAAYVLDAASRTGNGDIITIEQGTPVMVNELARDLIKLSGYSLQDIPIVYGN